MLFEHMSRERAEAYRGSRPYAVISITDPAYPVAKLQDDPRRVGVLRLQFHDFPHEPEEFKALIAAGQDWDDEPKTKWVLPDAKHARAIVDFFHEMQPQVEQVVIHCEAGISRSAAVGAALARCLRQTDEQFYRLSHPNHRVIKLVEQAWYERSRGR